MWVYVHIYVHFRLRRGKIAAEVIYMNDLRDNPFDATREVVITLRDRAIEASVSELKHQDELTLAVRSALKNGMDINDLSEASGLTPKQIQARVERDLNIGEDLAGLAGMR